MYIEQQWFELDRSNLNLEGWKIPIRFFKRDWILVVFRTAFEGFQRPIYYLVVTALRFEI